MEVGVVHSEAGAEPLGSSLCGREEPPPSQGSLSYWGQAGTEEAPGPASEHPQPGHGGRGQTHTIVNSKFGRGRHAPQRRAGADGQQGSRRQVPAAPVPPSYQQPLLWAGLCGAQGAHGSARPRTERPRAGPGPPGPPRPAVWTPWGAQSQLRQPGDSPSPAGTQPCTHCALSRGSLDA